jgi:hypothetical protein
MQDLFGKGSEILYKEPVAARRKDAAAGFMARKLLAINGHGLVARVNQAFGASRRGKPRADYKRVHLTRSAV